MSGYHNCDNVLGGNYFVSTKVKYRDCAVSQLNKNIYENRVFIAEIPESADHSVSAERTNSLTSSYGENDEENCEETPGINTSFAEAASQQSHFAGEHDLDKTPELAKQKILQELSEIRELENTALNVSATAISMEVAEEKFERDDAGESIIHGINTGEEEEFKEVSVQTVEERLFSCQDSCPICKLEDEDLKKKLTILCLECPPYKKRRVIGYEGFVNNDLELGVVDVHGICEERKAQECGSNEKIAYSDEKILPKYISFNENMGGGKRDGKEFPCRTIRLGLSRNVKLASLHKIPASNKRNLVDPS